jgi:hypothetical protein
MPSANTSPGSAAAARRAGAAEHSAATEIVLLAGRVKVPDRVGHHDYLAGCALLAFMLEQTAGVHATVVRDGWPEDETILDRADALVCYSGGGNKLAFLRSSQRVERLQRLIDRGAGVVMMHQAVSYPPEFAARAMGWLGGVHVRGESERGHWTTHHRAFPVHPVTRGVDAWKIRDGWMTEIQFVDGMRGVTPLLWSSRQDGGVDHGKTDEIVAWTYERPNGGRSFCFTGLDAHSAWAAQGVRRLLVNGTLWSGGRQVPAAGAPCSIGASALREYLTPRGSRSAWLARLLQRGLRKLTKPRDRPQTAARTASRQGHR